MRTFRLLLAPFVVLLTTLLRVAAVPLEESRAVGISQAIYDNLVLYTKYCAASYGLTCPRPVGSTLVQKVNNLFSGTNGYIARDDGRKEIIVAFRGSSEPIDVLVDLRINLKPLRSEGLTGVGDAQVHAGFLDAYNSVASDVLRIVKRQLATYPSYRIVVTGHSLGGAIAALAAISIRAALPRVPLQLYTFGQPRVGNAGFARYVERLVGTSNIFRAVHTWDGVPTIPPRFLGYQHFATEYWNFREPPSPANTRKCVGGEDPSCSASIPSTGINSPHAVYFGRLMIATPFLCL